MLSPLRTRLAVLAGRFVGQAYRLSGRGGDGASTRGRAMLAVDPNALHTLAQGRRTVMITGTNGKTTTTHLAVAALGQAATNASGANMPSGIVAAYAESEHPSAIIEVDELYIDIVARQVKPVAIVALNLFRDQLDRMHEVARIGRRWQQAFRAAGALVIANPADPHVAYAAMDVDHLWFDPGLRWADDSATCPRCGSLVHWSVRRWACKCGLSMPAPDAWVDDDGLHFADGGCQPFSLKLPGAVNRGNAGAALLAARVLGAPLAQAAERLADMRSASGRYASIRVGGRMARLVLAKNPASWRAVMQWAADHPIIAIVNARASDGRDTSWLYDVPFEVFQGRALGACGERAADVALRLHVAGVRPIVGADLDHVARLMPAGELHVLASYSAFTLLRRQAVEAP